jgi:carboxypeptidase D
MRMRLINRKAYDFLINATNRVLVSNGDLNFYFPTNATMMVLQNITWNGALRFRNKSLSKPINMPTSSKAPDGSPQENAGIQHHERGLMWAETFQAGHAQTLDQRKACYRHIQWLLGHRQQL